MAGANLRFAPINPLRKTLNPKRSPPLTFKNQKYSAFAKFFKKI